MIKVKHSHGQTDTFEDLDEALAGLREVYGDEIETEGRLSEGRVLVWRDAQDAANDDGRRTCASITETHPAD